MMKFILISVLMVFMVAQAGASESVDASKKKRDPIWSVGVGIGFGSMYVYGGPLGVSPVHSSNPSSVFDDPALAGSGGYISSGPKGILLLERIIGDSFAAMLRISGGKWNSEGNYDQDGSKTDSASIAAIAGIRWILNPGWLVEVSPYLAVGGGWSWGELNSVTTRDDGDIHTWTRKSTGNTVGASIGFVIERELIEALFLRIESSIVRVDYSWYESHSEDDGLVTPFSSKRLYANFIFNPAIQLRLAF